MLEMLKYRIKRLFKVHRRLELVEGSNTYLRQENHQLKGQMISKRKKITALDKSLLNTINELNLLDGKYKKTSEKLVKATKHIAEGAKRRKEFLHRIQIQVPDSNSFPDYKYWLSEPFIVDKFEHYIQSVEPIDEVSALKGLDIILDKVDEK